MILTLLAIIVVIAALVFNYLQVMGPIDVLVGIAVLLLCLRALSKDINEAVSK